MTSRKLDESARGASADAITPVTIEVVELHHDLIGCRVNGHQWEALPLESDFDYECTECGAYGQRVRPMGVTR